jgi:hypothetical protein
LYLGKSNEPDELPLRPAEGRVGTGFCPALPHILLPAKTVTTAAVCSIRMLDWFFIINLMPVTHVMRYWMAFYI